MKKLDLNAMKMLTSNFQTKINLDWTDENGEKLFIEVKGLSLNDFSYLVEKIPHQTILNFVEGFSDKDIEQINDFVIEKTEKSFNDIYYSIIAAGSEQYHQEETLKRILTTPQALVAFKSIMAQTIPQNNEELNEIKQAFDKLGENNGKKLKKVLSCIKDIVEIMASK